MGKKQTSRELLTDAILTLSEKIPVSQISVKMLALESGLCIATFYNHFTDKDALLLWIHQLGHDAIMESLRKGQIGPEDILPSYISYYSGHYTVQQT